MLCKPIVRNLDLYYVCYYIIICTVLMYLSQSCLLWNDCISNFVSLRSQGRLPFLQVGTFQKQIKERQLFLEKIVGYLNYYLHALLNVELCLLSESTVYRTLYLKLYLLSELTVSRTLAIIRIDCIQNFVYRTLPIIRVDCM